MKKNLTEIIILTDRSGSMKSIQSDMEGGLKSFIEKQKEEKGECRITHYEFDDVIDLKINNVNIKDVEQITISPRGMTALFDALGKVINEVGERLSKTKEKDKPESIIVITATDGLENASKEFNSRQIAEMIKHQEIKYSWKFIYLGANQDAFAIGKAYGFQGATSLTYGTDSKSIGNTFAVLSEGVSKMRCCSTADYSFSDSQRKSAVGL